MKEERMPAFSDQLRGKNISWNRPLQAPDFRTEFGGHLSQLMP
jgi:hypothetical protein